jgi:hypothetical protein
MRLSRAENNLLRIGEAILIAAVAGRHDARSRAAPIKAR